MIIKLLTLIVFYLGLLSCTKTSDNKINIGQPDSLKSLKTDTTEAVDDGYTDILKLESYLVTSELDTSKLQLVDFDCAVSIFPTDKQIEEIKKSCKDEDDFYTGADDNQWYIGKANLIIDDSVGVKRITDSRDFIKFVGDKETWVLDIRKKKYLAWGLILFKRDKKPKIVETSGLTTDSVRNYFDIKKK